jgi:UDPglucose 6-dehydrogenase
MSNQKTDLTDLFPRATFDPDGPAPRIAVLGTGYLGATHAVAMAQLGMEVVGVDTDPHKVEMLTAGKVPFYEPGLPELLTSSMAKLQSGSPWLAIEIQLRASVSV